MEFGGGAFGRWLGISALVKAPERSLVSFPPRKYTGKTAPSQIPHVPWSQFPEFRTDRNKYLLFTSHPVYAISVTAARMNRGKPLQPVATCNTRRVKSSCFIVDSAGGREVNSHQRRELINHLTLSKHQTVIPNLNMCQNQLGSLSKYPQTPTPHLPDSLIQF